MKYALGRPKKTKNVGENFGRPKKTKNVGENLPKNQGGPQYDQFGNLSSFMDSALLDTKITPPPKSLRGREIMGQIFEFNPCHKRKVAHP